MKAFINNLQNKDYNTRRNILIAATIVASLFIITIWIMLMRMTRTDALAPSAPSPIDQKKVETRSWSSIGNEISNTWGEVKEEFAGFSEKFEQIASTTASSTLNQ